VTEAPDRRRTVVYRLEDGWRGWFSYEAALQIGTITWLAARKGGLPNDPDPSLWPRVSGPLYAEGWERTKVYLRPSAIVAFEVLDS
jgi:hypothetical protein